MRDVSSSETITGNFTMMFLSFERFQLNKPKRPPLVQAALVRAFNGVETMKHSINIIIPTIVLGVTLLGLTVLWRGGLVDIQLRPGTTIKVIGPEKGKVQ